MPPFPYAVGRLIEDSSCESTLQNIIFLEYSNIPFLEEEAEAQGGYVIGLSQHRGLTYRPFLRKAILSVRGSSEGSEGSGCVLGRLLNYVPYHFSPAFPISGHLKILIFCLIKI